MNTGRLVFREISLRRFHFVLGCLSVAVAAGIITGTLVLLRGYDLVTEAMAADRERQAQKDMAKLEDDYRKIMKNLGFNVLILPKAQNLADLYAEDYASKDMPEEYAQRLSRAGVVTINHILPSLQRKIKWPEAERVVILIGTRGEVVGPGAAKSPMLDVVAPGDIILGHELHRGLKVAAGDRVTLFGRPFTVRKCHPERGTKDDITAWIALKEAQDLLQMPGRINAILALECVCAADSLEKVRAEIGKVLPDTQVIEFQTQVLARAEARRRAADAARAGVESVRIDRAVQRRSREMFASLLVPLVTIAAAAWVGFLAWGNVRERRAEIGILRTIGLPTGRILMLFVVRAALMGVAGGMAGWAAGFAIGAGRSGLPPAAMMDVGLAALVILLSPAIAVLAAWIPALLAAGTDPAEILHEG